MRYEIQIIRLPEEKPSGEEFRRITGGILESRADILFNANMQSDHAIEILNHLYNLKEREGLENTPRKAIN